MSDVPLIVLVILSVVAGALVVALARRYPAADVASPAAIASATDSAQKTLVRHARLRSFVAARRNPGTATGLVLTLALVLVLGAGLVLALLAYLIRSNPQLRSIDNGAASWGADHATAFSTHGLNVVTDLGSWSVVAPLAILVVVVESLRAPSRWIVPFMVLLMAGNEALMLSLKDIVDRARPTLNPITATLGPSFPSGHSATAAAFYAGAALLLARRRPRRWRTSLAGAAVAIAVGVAASRVLLDVHWVSDVVAGLLLGWGWFAICSIAFGGRLLHFGAPAEAIVGGAKQIEARRRTLPWAIRVRRAQLPRSR
jgi:undecaprenyl-diphosphatase